MVTARGLLSAAGIGGIALILGGALRLIPAPAPRAGTGTGAAGLATLRFLAVGDINLGRSVGQELLRGDTSFPFVHASETFFRFDVVFGNLESPLSDQGGITVHPRNPLVFTGPPSGALSLARAGVTVVSLANNHALDFGVAAAAETRRYLDAAGVQHAGTGVDEEEVCRPAIVERHGIRVALVACTDVMNRSGEEWKRHVAAADTGWVRQAIRAVRDSVDWVIISYHGGSEYADTPTETTRRFARAVLSGGADLFLGHHPHVPQGIELIGGKPAVWSLGNFVFRQFGREWTRRSFGISVLLVKDRSGIRLEGLEVLPLVADGQPRFLNHGPDAERVLSRLQHLSSREVVERWLCYDTVRSSLSSASPSLSRAVVLPGR